MIELMKFDMGGSAAVLGAAKALGQIKPAGVEVNHFVSRHFKDMVFTSLDSCASLCFPSIPIRLSCCLLFTGYKSVYLHRF